ncbi:hypothetical protein WJX72_011303 [[Myrmecia] bisecta]|uniref:TF-B3 domain-containing protein n=1 Tax=[Myrmecia] bisecta TaxID=41462 RepID=A0AAW1R966_9CHLO
MVIAQQQAETEGQLPSVFAPDSFQAAPRLASTQATTLLGGVEPLSGLFDRSEGMCHLGSSAALVFTSNAASQVLQMEEQLSLPQPAIMGATVSEPKSQPSLAAPLSQGLAAPAGTPARTSPSQNARRPAPSPKPNPEPDPEQRRVLRPRTRRNLVQDLSEDSRASEDTDSDDEGRGAGQGGAGEVVLGSFAMINTGSGEETDSPAYVMFPLPVVRNTAANGPHPTDDDHAQKLMAGPRKVGGPYRDVKCQFLFQKRLTASDTNKLGRTILPRVSVEQYFPRVDERRGLGIDFWDASGLVWTFRFKYWMNGVPVPKRMYLLENMRGFVRAKNLHAGVFLAFYLAADGRLVVDENPVETYFQGMQSGDESE